MVYKEVIYQYSGAGLSSDPQTSSSRSHACPPPCQRNVGRTSEALPSTTRSRYRRYTDITILEEMDRIPLQALGIPGMGQVCGLGQGGNNYWWFLSINSVVLFHLLYSFPLDPPPLPSTSSPPPPSLPLNPVPSLLLPSPLFPFPPPCPSLHLVWMLP